MGLFSRNSSKDADNVALAAARARLSTEDVDQVRFLITTKKNLFAVKLVHERTGPARSRPPVNSTKRPRWSSARPA